MHNYEPEWIIDRRVLLFSSIGSSNTTGILRKQLVPYLEQGTEPVHLVIDLRTHNRTHEMVSTVVRLAGELETHPKYGCTVLITDRGVSRFSFKDPGDTALDQREHTIQRALHLLENVDRSIAQPVGTLALAQ